MASFTVVTRKPTQNTNKKFDLVYKVVNVFLFVRLCQNVLQLLSPESLLSRRRQVHTVLDVVGDVVPDDLVLKSCSETRLLCRSEVFIEGHLPTHQSTFGTTICPYYVDGKDTWFFLICTCVVDTCHRRLPSPFRPSS